MFHPFVIYGIFCDTCKKLFRDPGFTGFAPITEPKVDDFCREILEEQGWRVVGDATLCPDHVHYRPPAAQEPRKLRSENQRLHQENDRLRAELRRLRTHLEARG